MAPVADALGNLRRSLSEEYVPVMPMQAVQHGTALQNMLDSFLNPTTSTVLSALGGLASLYGAYQLANSVKPVYTMRGQHQYVDSAIKSATGNLTAQLLNEMKKEYEETEGAYSYSAEDAFQKPRRAD